MEKFKGICGNQEGAKHKHGIIFPTTQGATFQIFEKSEREVRGLPAHRAGLWKLQGGLQESVSQSLLWFSATMASAISYD